MQAVIKKQEVIFIGQSMEQMKKFLSYDKDTIMSVGIVFNTTILFYCVIYCCARSFGFTDESFYLINIESPSLYYEGSQFGFVYHILYELLGRNIFIFRIVDFLFFVSLSILLIFLVMRIKLSYIYIKNNITMIFGIASCAFLQNSMNLYGYVIYWIATPSYNSLNFESLLICIIGIVLMENDTNIQHIAAIILIGFGISLSFLAKPTSALLLSFFVTCYLLVSKNNIIKKNIYITNIYIYIVVCIHIVVSAYIIDGSLYDFLLRMKIVGQYAGIAQDGHGVLEVYRKIFKGLYFIESKHPHISFYIYLLLFPSAIICILLWGIIGKAFSDRCTLLFTLSCCIICIVMIFIFYKYIPPRTVEFVSLSTNFSIIIVSAMCIIFVYLSDYRNIFEINFYKNIPLALLFFVMPLVYAVGTNLDYFYFAGRVSLFWVLGAVIMARPLADKKGWNFLLPYIIVLQLIVSFSMAICKQFPYRQDTNMGELQVETQIGGATLKLSEAFARYIEEARRNAQQGGFVPGTPVVDLTGQSPGILYALGAEAVGRGWFLGSSPGCLQFAAHVLREQVPSEKLKRSWFLVEPGGWRSISNEIFDQLGLNFPVDYELKAEWQAPAGAGARNGPAKQLLYAPKIH